MVNKTWTNQKSKHSSETAAMPHFLVHTAGAMIMWFCQEAWNNSKYPSITGKWIEFITWEKARNEDAQIDALGKNTKLSSLINMHGKTSRSDQRIDMLTIQVPPYQPIFP